MIGSRKDGWYLCENLGEFLLLVTGIYAWYIIFDLLKLCHLFFFIVLTVKRNTGRSMKEATQRTRKDLPGSSISNNILCIPLEPPVLFHFVLLLILCGGLKSSDNFSDAKKRAEISVISWGNNGCANMNPLAAELCETWVKTWAIDRSCS